jgi:LmbE family N-acetylglucosaminyl deacetylase
VLTSQSKNIKAGIQLTAAIIILMTGLFLLDKVLIGPWFRIPLYILTWIYIIICLFSFVLWIFIVGRRKNYIPAADGNILIVAPHQDDGVAMAGGHAIQTLQNGDDVTILFITDGYEDDKVTRKQEALNAWALIGLDAKHLQFLKHHNYVGLLEKNEIDKCIEEIKECIERTNPGTVFVPLYEGGNYQHDLTNYMVTRAIESLNCELKIFEAPIYNFFFSFMTTPEKIMSGAIRFIPFMKYHYSAEPIRSEPLYYLKMSPQQIKLKQEMLSKFNTQNPHRLIERLGFEDRFQLMHNYDYHLPPFNYETSPVKVINFLKAMPVIGRVMSKMVKWTRTIHPSPNYTITKIPL